MQSINFIAKHLDISLVNKQIYDCDTICAFTGTAIKQGVKLKDVTSFNFTDYEYIKHDSEYVSLETAACLLNTLRTPEGKISGLRNYSYIVTTDYLKLLKRDEILPILLTPPIPPFLIAYSFNNKKHTSFKAKINYSTQQINICTDILGNVNISRSLLLEIYPILQKWYTKNLALHKENFTYFSKTEILNGCDNYKKITQYGMDRYKEENEFLKRHRNTPYLELIVRLLNIKVQND